MSLRERCARAGRLAIAASVCLTASAASGQAYPEWTLYAPFFGGSNTSTHLLDLDGNIVHTWPSGFAPGASVYLVDDGAIIRPANDPSVRSFGGAGVGGRIERIAWDGTVEWSYVAAGENYVQHHDIEVLPNGNILAIVWEQFSAAEAIAMGRDPEMVGASVWSEAILEIDPNGGDGGEVVWEWHVWDHLVQDFDESLPNYGDPADHPGRIDINYQTTSADWLHWNAIDYNAALDQIVISCHSFNEIWIISHDPTDAGDLLYRWGNPEAYGRGTVADTRLFGQHDPEWIPAGLPGAGNLTIFNNGNGRGFSSIEELDTGVNPDGTYALRADGTFGPDGFAWSCDLIDGAAFSSGFMSGAQRLPNGNTLVCLAVGGQFVEIDSACSTVWEHTVGPAIFRATRIGRRDSRLEDLLWCAADFNDDSLVDTQDVLDFLGAWAGGDVAGDQNGDGIFDTRDVVDFLNAWNAGCG